VVAVHRQAKNPLFMLLLIAVVLMLGCSNDNALLVKGKPTPRFNLLNMKGQLVHYPDDFDGQIVLISFWADWCPS